MAIIEYLAVSDLRPWHRNARTHSKKQVSQIAASIRQFGFTNPILIDDENAILAGHGRVAAAKMLGQTEVPCLRIDRMSPAEKRAYVLADNKLAQNAGWDEEILAQELKELSALDLGFALDLTGFSFPEIDSLVDELTPEDPGAPEDDALPSRAPKRCRPGDLWQLGPHRLICGDARCEKTVGRLMAGQLAEMVFTDPPFNVPIQGHVGGSGAIKHPEFQMAAGEMTSAEFTRFLQASFERLVDATTDGSIHFVCMDWRHLPEIFAAADATYAEMKNLIVWAKDNAGMGSFYRSRHELIFAFKNGQAPHINNFELGQHGRHRTNVWSYRGLNMFASGRLDELSLHPTAKPVQMIADALRDVSRRGGTVLDTFGGSGSTLIAAEKTGRRARLCELDPTYCDRILRRWEDYARDEAELIERVGA